MASCNRAVALSVGRKLLLATAIPLVAVEAHLRWGFEYVGPGMHHVGLLFTIGTIAAFCSVLFLLCAGGAAWILWRKAWPAHWFADLVLFCALCSFAVWVAVVAKVE